MFFSLIFSVYLCKNKFIYLKKTYDIMWFNVFSYYIYIYIKDNI